VACVGDAGGGRAHPQRPPRIPDRGFSEPEPRLVAKLVGHFALAALECLGKLVRRGNADRDDFSGVVEQCYFRRIIPII
jgi:hypothetical protein